jgi:hypothetical protein
LEDLKEGLEDAIASEKGKKTLRSHNVEILEKPSVYTAKEIRKTGSLLAMRVVFSGSKMRFSAKAKTDSSTCLGIPSLLWHVSVMQVNWNSR